MRKLKPLTRRQFTAKDSERCEASIPWAKDETAQCRRRKVAGSYCKQHASEALFAARVVTAIKCGPAK